MAVDLVANGSAYTGASASTHAVDMPDGLSNGDVITVGFCVNNTATVSASGWTQEINETFTGASLVVMTHVVTDAGSEPSSVTFTFSSAQSTNAGASAWSGADTSDPTSVIGSFASVSVGSSINAPSITTAEDGEMAVAMCAVNSSTQVWGTAPWTGDFQTTGAQCWAQSHLAMPTAGATGTATFQLDTKDAGAIVFSLRVGTPPSPVPDAVDDLSGTAGDGEVDLSWTEPALNGSTLLDPAYQGRYRTAGVDPPAIVDPTSSGNDTAAGTQNVAYPAHSTGDLVIQSISIDANVTATVPTSGPNGEMITALATNANPGTAGPRGSAWWWVSTGDETAGNIAVTLSASEQTSSECVVIPAGTFDPLDPIPDVSSVGTQTSGTGTTITFPGLTATVAGGLVVVMGGVDADPMDNPFSPAGWSDVITHDQGAVSSFVARRDALTTLSESVSSAAFGIDAGDTAWCVGFVVAPAGSPAGDWIELPAMISVASSVTADAETEVWSGASGDVADDPAIYYHAADPAASIILGSSKSTGADGGVHSFDLDGVLLDSWLIGEVNSVDLIDTATVAGIDSSWADRVLVLATERGDGDLVFGFLNRTTGEITSAGTTAVGWQPYGCCLYVSPVDQAVYAFVNEATGGSNRWRQFELTVSGSTVSGSLVRSGSTESLAEGICADYQNGRILIGIEDDRLASFLPEPGDATTLTTIEAEGVHFTADIEGITVVPAMNGQHGVIIVSSQGSSEFVVYNLDDDSYMGTFTVTAGSADAVTGTDGIAALRAPLGSSWPNGLLVVHDETNTGGAGSNFKLLDLGDILGPIPAGFDLSGTTATISGLTNDVAYEFQIRALSDGGPGPWSNTAGPYTPTAAGGETASTTGTITLTLTATGTVAKSAGTAGAIALQVSPTDDVSKTGQTVGDLDVVLAALGTATKTGAATGSVSVGLDVAGVAAKIAATVGDLAVELGLTGDVTTTETKSTTGTITLAMLLEAAAAKDAATVGAIALAAELAADTAKLGQVAGALGLTVTATGTAAKTGATAGGLDLALGLAGDTAKTAATAGDITVTLTATGDVVALGTDSTLGTLALALAIVGTAAKVAATTGTLTIGLTLDGTTAKTTGTTGTVDVELAATGTASATSASASTTGTLALALDLTAAAGKLTATVGAVSLILAITGTVPPLVPLIITGATRTVTDVTTPRTVTDHTPARTVIEVTA